MLCLSLFIIFIKLILIENEIFKFFEGINKHKKNLIINVK